MLDIPEEFPRLPIPRHIPNYMGSKATAENLARIIQEYWRRRGKFPNVWVTKNKAIKYKNNPVVMLHGEDLDGGVWVVRSDMKCGAPQ